MIHFDDVTFEEALARDGLLLVDFWAVWCGPCRMIAPYIEEIASEYEGRVTVGKVDVDEYPELAQRFSISSIPAVLLFRNGELVDSLVGAGPKSMFTGMIDRNL